MIPLQRSRGAPSSLATVHVLAQQRMRNVAERELDARSVLDWAWAAHQRMFGAADRISYRRVVTGAERATPGELFSSRVAVRALPDCEEWLETLQHEGRTLLEVFESATSFTPAPDGHDCDCTCEGGPSHARWELLPAQWRPVRPGALLQKLARGFTVKVRLASK